MQYKITSAEPIDIVLEKLIENLKREGFGVVHKYKFNEILRDKGFDYSGDATVIEVCNPSVANSVLNYDSAAAIHMPCKIALSTKDNRSVISMNNIEKLIQYSDEDEKIKTDILEVFNRLRKILNDL